MLNKLDQLRQKPEAYRKRVAFVTAFSITAIIFIGWIVSPVSGVDVRSVESGHNRSEVETDSPVSMILERVATGWAGLTERLADLERSLDSLRSQVYSVDRSGVEAVGDQKD